MQAGKINISIIFLFFSCIFYAQNAVIQNEIKAKIDVEKVESNITITGTAENMTNITKSASYKLSVIKNNHINNNSSNNSQDGVFTLKPNEKIKLSTTQVNLTSDDEVIVLLLFFNENKEIISKDRMVFGDEKKKTN
ncbi:curli-like amyloid fiber formation chaperone CsgH [Flavobacterium sp.]|uniref:curli-like amyloid fiber formation chaperone CsgH n=1 Tax=Flavobacterium sp. TaxID=239 RepID=UPI002D1033D2|nr:curli-like amyloid fiber formation chaperone CsgH [Flavobacterium sp.]HSD05997.1 curli-like amyloid fiber formation chaperone CsgH [Flavobacterium sp.]